MVDREVDAGGCAARRDASFFDTTRSTRKDRADGASHARRARARRNARDGKGQNKTGSLGAGRGGDRGFFGPVVSLGFPAVGRRAHLRVSRQQGESPILELFASPIRGGHRLAFASTPRSRPPEVSRGTVECTRARKKNKERCLLQTDACSRGAPTECLSRDASTIFLATPGAHRSAALGRRRSARRVNVNGRNISPLPKSFSTLAPFEEHFKISWHFLGFARQICGPKAFLKIRPSIDRPVASTRAQSGGNGEMRSEMREIPPRPGRDSSRDRG